jgi:hypothetical protein
MENKKEKRFIPTFLFIEIIFFLCVSIILFIVSQGVVLYEILLIIFISISIGTFIFIVKLKMNTEKRINLILTLAIVFFAMVQVWAIFYEMIPRVYTPGVICPNFIDINEGGYGNFSVSFGNYGKLPAWLEFNFINTTKTLSVTGETNYTIVLIPINYRDNKQDNFNFKFRITNGAQIIGFKLRYLVYGDDIIDKFSMVLKKTLKLYNELPCEYSNVNNITYSSIPNKP